MEGKRIEYTDIAFAVVILLIVIFSSQVRLDQYRAWQEEPERHFAEGRPLLTSSDAYYWTRLAQEYRDGGYYDTVHDPLRAYPDGAKKPRPVPLLSFMIATASSAAGIDLFEAGIYLIPLLAGLFVLPLALYFRRIGLPAAAITAGLVTSFCQEYYTRTSIGRVDTDALNLFFPLLASLFILFAMESDSRKRACLFSLLAGLTMLLFYWWYFHAGFTIAYLGMLVACLTIARRGWRTVLCSAGLFIAASNPMWLWKGMVGIGSFVITTVLGTKADAVSESVNLPAVLHTVTEFQREPPAETLALILREPMLAALGLVLFVPLAVTRWKRLLPLLPVLGLGLLSFTSGRRFTLFLALFVGAGYGWLLTVVLDRLLQRTGMRQRFRQLSIFGACLLLFAALWGQTAVKYVPEPSITSKSISAIVRLKQRLPEHSVVLSWWDYGYALTGLGGFATYHDGSFHRVNTYLIARALSSTSQEELYGTIVFMNDTGEERLLEMLADNPAAAELLEGAGRSGGSVARDDVYVLMLGAMVQKYAAIHYLGNWDLRNGSSRAEGYQRLECSAWAGDTIDCGEMTIDTKTGHIREDLSLEKLILIRDGRHFQEMVYPNKTGVYLQVLLEGESAYGFLLLNERVLQSNFNRMFFLGQFDRTLYEEAYNDFPTARVFRLRGVKSSPVTGHSPSDR